MAFKKDLTPLGKRGRIDTQVGKGSTLQRNAPRAQETLTGGNPMARMMNQYPAAPQPAPNMQAPAPQPPMMQGLPPGMPPKV